MPFAAPHSSIATTGGSPAALVGTTTHDPDRAEASATADELADLTEARAQFAACFETARIAAGVMPRAGDLLVPGLQTLGRLLREQFEVEDAVMVATDYRRAASHRRDHAWILRAFDGHCKLITQGSMTAIQVLTTLDAHLNDHNRNQDRALAQFLSGFYSCPVSHADPGATGPLPASPL